MKNIFNFALTVKTFKATMSLFCILLLTANVQAENMVTQGDINIHYIALNSTFLTPKIAKAYQLQRSRYMALINISVLDNSQANKPAKAVDISGKAKNLLGQQKSLTFKEVREGDAIYYLAQVKYSNEETLYFDIKINDQGKAHTLKFEQKFYAD